jgi:hypothetical protein
MIERLEQLSLAVGAVSPNDAKQVVDVVNDRVMGLLNAQVVKLYWREEAQEGFILDPLAYINSTRHANPMPFQISGRPSGVLSWVFHNQRPLWLEGLRSADLTKPIANNAAPDEDVPSEYLDMRPNPDMDSMMVVPIKVRGEVRGLYSVELQASGRLSKRILDLLEELVRSLGSLLWNADVYEYDLRKTSDAVAMFLKSVRQFSFDPIWLEQAYRSGFIARPFTADFSRLEEILVDMLQEDGVRARHYQPSAGGAYIIDEIMTQIRNSHFCICDLTGSNPNVMAEVGMMMILRKQMLLLRRKGEDAPVPFDVSQYPIYEYELGNDRQLRIWNAGENRFQPFDQILNRFIAQLPRDIGFDAAMEWAST